MAVTVDGLIKLLPHLKKHGVTRVRLGDAELVFHVEQSGPSALDQVKEHLTKAEEALPPDLRADSLMDQDKILNWSTQPDNNELPLPLTGDGEL